MQIAAAATLLASLAVGLTTLGRDLRFSRENAGPSVFSTADRKQIGAVKDSIPEGATVLLIASSVNGWYARLWQRGLYPRNQGVVVLEPFNPQTVQELRARYGIRHAVLLGSPPFDPGLRARHDLGSLAGQTGRVWFGELSP
jgi:hypothetical protein